MSNDKRVIVCDVPGRTCVIVSPGPGRTCEEVLHTIPSDTIKHSIVHRDSLPDDRYFRNAFKLEDDKCVVDMTKAKDIHKEYLRRIRKPKLEALDVEFMLAVEQEDKAKQKEIARKKQALRDITSDPRIDSKRKPESLKAFIPEVLLED